MLFIPKNAEPILVIRIEAAMSAEKSEIPLMDGVYLLLMAYFEEPQELMIKSFDVSVCCEVN
jgi:hypothetical protein